MFKKLIWMIKVDFLNRIFCYHSGTAGCYLNYSDNAAIDGDEYLYDYYVKKFETSMRKAKNILARLEILNNEDV